MRRLIALALLAAFPSLVLANEGVWPSNYMGSPGTSRGSAGGGVGGVGGGGGGGGAPAELEADYTVLIDADVDTFQLINGTTIADDDGEVVGYIEDLTGECTLTAAANDTTRPTLQTNELNGHSVLRFDGANDMLRSLACVPFNTGAGDWTFQIVFKNTSGTYPWGAGVPSGLSSVFMERISTDPDKHDIGTGGNQDVSPAAEMTDGTWHVLSLRYVGGVTIQVWVDDTYEGNPSSLMSGPLNLAATLDFYLGCYAIYGCGVIDVAFIVAYDDNLLDATVENNIDVLQTKYGL